MTERDIFVAALEIDNPADRHDYLAGACGSDTALRCRVDGLLNALNRAGDFLQTPPAADALLGLTPPEPHDAPGAFIGPYKLLEQIGEGGMGIVYVAEQTHPVRRRVALKLIKPGMDTREVVARFEAERQALALMDHQNIAKFLDAGTTGLPSGGRKPPVSDPPVSDPPVSDPPVSDPPVSDPPVLDRSRGTHVPRSGVPYFVMELVRGLPITDYCDRAALPPRDRLRLFAQVCRAVQHAHMKGVIHRDLKPSNVLVTLYDGTPVPKVIDFGVAKALGQSLTEKTLCTRFAQMVGTPLYMAPEQAELSGVDVDTRADVYSLGVLLYELLTGTTPFDADTLRRVGLDELRRMIREDEPPRPSQRLSQMRNAECGRKPASTPHSEFRIPHLWDLDWVVMRCLEKDRNRRYDSAGALAADVERYLADEPVEARPPSWSYRLRKSARRNRAALATAGVVAATLVAATAVSTWQAVVARKAQHRAEAAETRATTEAAIAKAVNDFFQQDVLLQVTSAPEAEDEFGGRRNITVREALLRAAARIDQAFADQPLVEAAVRTTIGEALFGVEEGALAIPHLERAVALRRVHCGPDHPDTLASMGSLAGALHRANRVKDAIALREQLWEAHKAALGSDHPKTLRSMAEFANVSHVASGDLEVCFRLQQQVVERTLLVLGPTHPDTLNAMNAMAITLRQMGRAHDAVALHEKVLELRKATNAGDADSFFFITFAVSCQAAGKLDQAELLLAEKLEIDRRRNDSIGQLKRATTLGWLARTRLLQQRYPEGERLAREALTIFEQEQPDGGNRYYWMTILGSLLAGQGKLDEAEFLLLQGYRGMRSSGVSPITDRHWRLRETCERIIHFYEITNRPDQARAWRGRLTP